MGTWPLEYPQMVLVVRRFNVTFRGIERLLQRHIAGRLWRIAQRTQAKREPCQRDPNDSREKSVVLPRRFGWLVIAGGYQAAGYGSQLQTVLSRPEMVALLAESPQAQRMLRPLCRALAMELPWVRGEPRKAREKKPRKPRVKPEPFRIPLPRGMLAAARRDAALEEAIKLRNELVLKMAK